MPENSDFSSLVKHLEHKLQGPLPGWSAQLNMAPPSREPFKGVPKDARRSATLALLYPIKQEPHIVFMKRTEDGYAHSGQVSFPGGRWEKTDPDLPFTALREAEEEMGIRASEVQVLGKLSDMYIPPSNSLVYPLVGYLPYRPNFIPEEEEVAEILEVPVADFLKDHMKGNFPVKVFNLKFETPGYLLHGKHVMWGATAMMMAELIDLIQSA